MPSRKNKPKGVKSAIPRPVTKRSETRHNEHMEEQNKTGVIRIHSTSAWTPEAQRTSGSIGKYLKDIADINIPVEEYRQASSLEDGPR